MSTLDGSTTVQAADDNQAVIEVGTEIDREETRRIKDILHNDYN